MRIANYLNRFRQYLRRGSPSWRREKLHSRPRLEQLEDRMVPSTLFVDAAGNAHYLASDGVVNNVTLSERHFLVDPPLPGTSPQFPLFLENLITDKSDTITVTGPGASRWLGSGTHQVGTFLPIPSLLVDVFQGNGVVNVQATNYAATVRHFGSGIDTVNVGDGGKLTGVNGPLVVQDLVGSGSTHLNVDDSTDGATHNNVILTGGLIANLGPALISYQFNPTSPSFVTVTGGTPVSGTNVYNVAGPSAPTTLNTGGGSNQVNVRATAPGASLFIQGHGGNDTVIVGNKAPVLGGTQGSILAPVTVANTTGATHLIVDDRGDPVPRFVKIGFNTIQFLGTGSQIFYLGVKILDVFGGTLVPPLGDTFFIQTPPLAPSVNIFGGAGNNTLIGANVFNQWNITGLNAGNVGKVSFTSIQNLIGGTAGNTFHFSDQAGVSGNINGGSASGNTFDYSAYTTPVFFSPPKATGVGGFVSNIQSVIF
jgi:hypothetical protein